MPWWKVLLLVLAICLPCIIVLEIINRVQKYRVRITKGLFDLDKRAQECPDAEVEQLWSDVCWFDVDTYKTHFQHLKMISIMAYVQARRAHIKRDTALSKTPEDKRLTAPPHYGQLHRGEAGPHGSDEGPSHPAA